MDIHHGEYTTRHADGSATSKPVQKVVIGQWVLLGVAEVLVMLGVGQQPHSAATRGVHPTPTVMATQVSDFLPPVYATTGSAARPPVWDPRLDEYNVTYHPAADCS